MNEIKKVLDNWSAALGPTTFALAAFGIIGSLMALDLYLNCRLLKRMGYPPFWGVLLWIYPASEIVWLGLAFWRWPRQKG